MKLSNHNQFYNFLSLDLFTYLMLKEFIFQCLFTRICTSSFKERLVILWKNQSTCYHWKVKDKNKSNISRWQFIGKTSKATPCYTMWLYFTDCYIMYVSNLQNVSKEHLGKHKENHALSTEHERKKTWTKEQLLLKDHRPTRALKKMKRENWLIDAYEKTTKHMVGGLTGDHTVVNCNNNNEKKKQH